MIGVLVIGPESSGTRFLTRLLIEAGCLGEYTHDQQFDNELPLPVMPIVWRRSIPHGSYWPDIPKIINIMELAGYDVRIIITCRDLFCMANSEIEDGHINDMDKAQERIARAYLHIFEGVKQSKALFMVTPYESISYQPKALIYILEWLGLPPIDINKIDFIQKDNERWL